MPLRAGTLGTRWHAIFLFLIAHGIVEKEIKKDRVPSRATDIPPLIATAGSNAMSAQRRVVKILHTLNRLDRWPVVCVWPGNGRGGISPGVGIACRGCLSLSINDWRWVDG